MNRSGTVALAKRMLDLIDRRATDLAPHLMREPVAAYTSPDVLQRERELIFGRTAMLLGMSADVPDPGSWRTMEIGDSPLLLWRDENGAVRLFLNSCRHRAVRICEGAGQARSLACPFHGWRYACDGSLTGVPEPEGFDELSRPDHGLVRLPVAEKYGLIFGSPTPGPAIEVDTLLQGLGPELGEWGFESFSLYTSHHVHPFRGNWKYAWDTYCENYHFAFLHAKTLSGYLVSRRQGSTSRPARTHGVGPAVDRRPPRAARGAVGSAQSHHHPVPALPVGQLLRLSGEDGGLLDTPRLEAGRRATASTPSTSVTRRRPTRSGPKLDESVRFGCEDIVNAEDLWITGQSEPGLRAPGSPGYVVFGRNEPVVQHFHTRFRERIGDESLADPAFGAPRRQ